jgi:NAD+ diphosphatase
MSTLYILAALNRADERRSDAEWLRAALAGSAKLVPVWKGLSLVAGSDARRAAVYVGAASVPAFASPIFLGIASDAGGDGAAYFAVDVEATDQDAALARLHAPADATFADLWQIGGSLAPSDESILGHARAMTYWHRHQRYCGTCGAPTESRSGGHVLCCTSEPCGRQHFPRTDPATIMLIHDEGGEHALLGRKAEWPAGRYSTLAGFVEPGESLEDAVVREVAEEVGIAVHRIRYFASQPWPYPASLMVGFFAEATTTDVRIGEELEDARWFTRDEVRAMFARWRLSLPGIDTIARRLIEAWLAGRTPRS